MALKWRFESPPCEPAAFYFSRLPRCGLRLPPSRSNYSLHSPDRKIEVRDARRRTHTIRRALQRRAAAGGFDAIHQYRSDHAGARRQGDGGQGGLGGPRAGAGRAPEIRAHPRALQRDPPGHRARWRSPSAPTTKAWLTGWKRRCRRRKSKCMARRRTSISPTITPCSIPRRRASSRTTSALRARANSTASSPRRWARCRRWWMPAAAPR